MDILKTINMDTVKTIKHKFETNPNNHKAFPDCLILHSSLSLLFLQVIMERLLLTLLPLLLHLRQKLTRQ